MTATAPSATAAAPRLRVAAHSLTLARRSLTKTLRTPEQLIDVTLQPVIFLSLFLYLLGGAVAGSRGEYLTFLLPAVMVQTVVFAATATGINLNNDISKGVFDRFRSLPIARSAPLLGAVLGDMIRSVVCVTVLLGFGYALGFRVATGPLSALAGCLLVLAFGFAVTWGSVLLGVLAREPGSVQGILFLAMFPLTFGTDMITPAETMPGWLQWWVNVNPVTDVMAAARALLTGGPAAGPVLRALAWSAALFAVLFPLAVRAYRRKT